MPEHRDNRSWPRPPRHDVVEAEIVAAPTGDVQERTSRSIAQVYENYQSSADADLQAGSALGHRLGTIAPAASAGGYAAGPATAHRPTPTSPAQIAALIGEPMRLREAILMAEVLRRPEW